MKKGLICFDLDNTLIKSNRCHLRAYQLAFKKNNVARKITNQRILRYFGEGSKIIVQKLFPKGSREFIDDIVHDHDFFVRTQTYHQAKIMPDAVVILKTLRKHWKLALISNCNHALIISLLKAVHIPRSWFKVIIGQDQVKHPKPAPDELLKAEHMLHLQAAYFVGDSIYDIRAGKRAKVPVIALTSGVNTASQLAREKPLVVCHSLRKVLSVIQ